MSFPEFHFRYYVGTSLLQRFTKCLLGAILTNACRSSIDAFRHQINSLECKVVFQTYQSVLEQIYRHYAASSNSLSISEFMIFLEVMYVRLSL
jgi:hypothetical protein